MDNKNVWLFSLLAFLNIGGLMTIISKRKISEWCVIRFNKRISELSIKLSVQKRHAIWYIDQFRVCRIFFSYETVKNDHRTGE